MTARIVPFPHRGPTPVAERSACFAQDGAAVVTTAILQIVVRPYAWLRRDHADIAAARAAIEALLRNEFTDIVRRRSTKFVRKTDDEPPARRRQITCTRKGSDHGYERRSFS